MLMMAGNVFCRSGVESILHLSSIDHFSAFSFSFNRGGRDDAEAGTTRNNGPGRHTVIIIRVHHHLNQAGRLAGISLHCTGYLTALYVAAVQGAEEHRQDDDKVEKRMCAELSLVSCDPRLLDRPR